MNRFRYLTHFAVFFSGAVFLLTAAPPLWVTCLAAAAAAGLAVGFALDPKRRGRVLLAVAGFGLGLGWWLLFRSLCYLPSTAPAGETVRFSGRAVDYAEETAYGGRVEVRLELDSGRPVRALLYFDGDPDKIAPGDRIAGVASFRLAEEVRGETSAYYTSQGIYLLGSVKQMEVTRCERVPIDCCPALARRALQDRIDMLFPGEEGALLRALLTGDRGRLSDGVTGDFARAGVSHVLAVSGLHIGFLVGLLYLFPGGKRRRAAAVIPILIFYALMTGASPSVCRAVVMASLVLLAPVLGRETDGPTTLSFALMLLLIQNPFSACSVSLQLSFASMLGILCFQRRLMEALTPKRFRHPARTWAQRWMFFPALRFFTGGLSLTLAAAVFTLPLTAFYFGELSLISLLANLLVVWAVSLCFAFGLIAALLGFFWTGAARLAAIPASLLGRYLLAVTGRLGGMPYASLPLHSDAAKIWAGFLFVMIGLLVVLPPMRRRPILPAGCAAALLFLALGLQIVQAMTSPLTVSVLDVGQGSCLLIRSGGASAAVDCGGNGDGNAGDVLADALNAAGQDTLPLLILTHYDTDHTNGVEQLLRRISVGAVLMPETADSSGRREELRTAAEAAGAQVLAVGEDLTIALGQAQLTVFAPLSREEGNDGGISLLCGLGEFDLLVTGDLSSRMEERLLEERSLPDLEVLVAGHHGSASSTGEILLKALQPETVILSVGYNTYGHPSEEVLDRLERYGCAVYRTDDSGTVTLRCG